ncbi:MAG: MarR family transcriptional regulator [Chitinophagaceae bacterium]|nr:MarR family transcriptional regulator [Chitinophagaceae bacterium]
MIKKNQNASLIFHIIRFSVRLRKNGDSITQKYGITAQQWLILLLLSKDPNIIYLQENPQDKPMLAKELATAMDVSRANITNLLNLLLRKKLIRQIADVDDKRRKRLTLTEKGKIIIIKLETERYKRNQRLFENYSKIEKEEFINFIKNGLAVIKYDLGG